MIFKAHEPERETPLRFHAGIGDYLIDAEAILAGGNPGLCPILRHQHCFN
jgi:hypothetical protein